MKLLIYRKEPVRMFFIHKAENECVDGTDLFDEMDKLHKEHPEWESFIVEDTNEWTTYHFMKEKVELPTPLDPKAHALDK
jgi:hypothetical protein